MKNKNVPSVSVTYAQNGGSTKSNELGMRAMQERAFEKRGEQYLLIKSPPASGNGIGNRTGVVVALGQVLDARNPVALAPSEWMCTPARPSGPTSYLLPTKGLWPHSLGEQARIQRIRNAGSYTFSRFSAQPVPKTARNL